MIGGKRKGEIEQIYGDVRYTGKCLVLWYMFCTFETKPAGEMIQFSLHMSFLSLSHSINNIVSGLRVNFVLYCSRASL